MPDPHDNPHSDHPTPPGPPVLTPQHAAPPPREPDPGSRFGTRLALIALCVMVPVVVVIQQIPHVMPLLDQWGITAIEDKEPVADTQETGKLGPAPGDGQFALASRGMLKVADAFTDPTTGPIFINQLASSAKEPGDKVRLAICEGELNSPDSALERLENIQTDDEELARDIDLLTALYTDGSESLNQEDRTRIETRYEWHGKLALLFDAPNDPARAQLLSGGWSIIVVFLVFFGVVGAAIIAGLVLAIIAVVKLSSGKIKPAFTPPAPGGGVYLELFAVFVAGFIVVQIISAALGAVLPDDAVLTATLVLQWLLIGLLAWPMLRGVPRERVARDLGWHRGQGIIREIFAGLAGYLAGLPLLLGAMLITLLVFAIWTVLTTPEGAEPQTPSNPVAEMIENTTPFELALLFSLATIWAPIVEESIFRGAVFRHLRGRMPWIAAGAGSALLFGLMHGYFILLLLPVITLGLIFSAIREWRDSLIGPMVAHGLHNATLLVFVSIIFRLLF